MTTNLDTPTPLAARAMLTALRNAGLAAHYDHRDSVVLAYPLATDRDSVTSTHHVMVVSLAFDAQWPFEWANFEAHAWAPGGPYGSERVKKLHDTPLDRREAAAEEAALCAKAAAEWLTTTSPTIPGTATAIMSALHNAGVGAFWETEQGVLIAHPNTTKQDDALKGEHVMIVWSATVQGIPIEERATLEATVWVPDGVPDFARIATVYTTADGRPIGEEAARCARAVAEWFAGPRQAAGDVLLAAFAEYDIAEGEELSVAYGTHSDRYSVAVPLPDGTHAQLVLADRDGSLRHLPAAHTGWSVFLHNERGDALGDPVYVSGDGDSVVDCAADSAAVAAVIADWMTSQVSRHCDCYGNERPSKPHDRECNRYRRP